MNLVDVWQARGAPTPVVDAPEDTVLELGWKYDPRRDRLGPHRTVYTWYRDAQRREGPLVSYILIRRYAPCGPAAAAA